MVQDSLTHQLHLVAAALVDPSERRGRGVRRLIGRTPVAECSVNDAYYHFALVAAFNAYCALGGNTQDPAAFPWEERRAQLVEWARKRLVSDIQGAHTTFGDFRSRRTARERMPRFWWDAWQMRGHRTTPGRDRMLRMPLIDVTQPERDLELAELNGLLEALRAVLNEYEAWVLHQHFWHGRALREIARDVVAGCCPELRYKCKRDYHGAAGLGRAEKQVQRTLQRALVRAGSRLAGWRKKAEDAACV